MNISEEFSNTETMECLSLEEFEDNTLIENEYYYYPTTYFARFIQFMFIIITVVFYIKIIQYKIQKKKIEKTPIIVCIIFTLLTIGAFTLKILK